MVCKETKQQLSLRRLVVAQSVFCVALTTAAGCGESCQSGPSPADISFDSSDVAWVREEHSEASLFYRGPLPDLHPESICFENPQLSCFLYIPGGTFTRGAQATDASAPGHDPHAQPDEGPPSEVTISPFWIQENEVPVYDYERCVEEGTCPRDAVKTGGGFSNMGRPGRSHHPVNSISWDGAVAYCRTLGGRLPTEAEWELVARGLDGRPFPWGETPRCATKVTSKSGSRVNNENWAPRLSCANKETASVGNLVGRSPYGAIGMAGNVWEWTADWYAADAYTKQATTDPRGPAGGTERVVRGGGWTEETPWDLRTTARASWPPEFQLYDVGFRCAWDGLNAPTVPRPGSARNAKHHEPTAQTNPVAAPAPSGNQQAPSAVHIFPSRVMFRSTKDAPEEEQSFRVQNESKRPITIMSVDVREGSPFQLQASHSLPVDVPAGEEVAFGLRYTLCDPLSDRATVRVHLTDHPSSPLILEIGHEGAFE